MAKNILQRIFGTKQEKDLKRLTPILKQVRSWESWAEELPDAQFPQITEAFRQRISEGQSLTSLLPEAFALAREASYRVLGEKHFDEQIMGAVVLFEGNILEMKTGEGKTLTCVPAAYLNALTSKGVHIITVNDYLAERDAAWMGPIYRFLGLDVAAIVSSMDNEARREAYSKDITYGTNNEFGFDYLRDNMKYRQQDKIQPNHNYAIIDEIDSILIDEARTPLIISGQAEDDTARIAQAARVVPLLTPCELNPDTLEYDDDAPGDYRSEEKHKRVTFTTEGLNHAEQILQMHKSITGSLYDNENFEFVHYLTQAVKAQRLFHRDVDYVVADGKVEIVDEFTGRVLHGRRYSDGLHQAIEAKEGIKIASQNKTLATITFQNFFRMYDTIAGMTGTADTEAGEFNAIYNLDVIVIPTHLPIARNDMHDLVYLNETYKYEAIINEIERVHATGQPILVGTVTIEKSELISSLLKKRGIRHEVLNAKNHAREALIIEDAGAKGAITIATNMAGRGTDIKLGGSFDAMVRREVSSTSTPEEIEATRARLRPLWQERYEEVKKNGGLYILGTERHESRRIDNQLRGRSGRQGDPGASRFFLSLDDTLMRLFAKDTVRSMLSRVGMGAEPIEHGMISRAIEKAQMRVEEQNYEIRKHLLEYDDVLNEQRNFIYSQRDAILSDENLVNRGLETIQDTLKVFAEQVEKESSSSQRLQMFTNLVQETYQIDIHQNMEERLTEDSDLAATAFRLICDLINEKVSRVSPGMFNDFLRYHYLKQIDTRWQNHLDQLEGLRESVNLRAYAQKNPLLEYKLEGFDIFDTLIASIREYMALLMVRVQIQSDAKVPSRAARSQAVNLHQDVSSFNRPSAGAQAGQTGPVQVKRTTPKVGRNDPCPCGSGKKYKHCHGRND
ncbi:MAG: preprotein translocase subunit SecA [Sphaerochaetaceae bacterium]|nr:preprotein translocase subunit SecA [Sphaerochaetaceae bacterium]